jgi:hypothetical protein
VKLHIEEAEHCETLGILCECGKKFKGNTSGGYYYHRLALHGHKPLPKIGLAASTATATGDPHLTSSGLAASTATATGDPHPSNIVLAASTATATGDPHPSNIVLAASTATATGDPHPPPNIVLAASTATATGDPHPPPNIVLAASTATATGDLHPPNIDLAANPASESHFAFEQVEEEVVQNCDHQYNLKGVARKFSSLFCFFNHIFSADPGCLSLIRLFSIPDPESELYPSRIRCLFDPWIRNPE